MMKLLKKEVVLSMHPTAVIMLLLSVMVLIPNYPYTVIFFYTALSVFFTCLAGRENNDISYTLTLPIAKKDIVKGRMGFVVLQELLQLVLMIPFIILSARINPMGNQAGTDANLALLGIGFLIYAVFNYTFFTQYYKNVNQIGKSFVLSSVIIFVLVALEVVCSYVVPYFSDYVDTPGFDYLPSKLAVLFIGLGLYIVVTLAAYRKSVTLFLKQDL